MKTRLAPSPTGALHLGNARTFLVNWALARQNGWKVLLRIEDLDGPRVKPEARDGIMRALEWLGLDWDEGPVTQSDDLAPYREAMKKLAESGLAFPCKLTRGEIAAASSAPQEGAHELRYDPSLRPKSWERSFKEEETNWRFLVPAGALSFTDLFAGRRSPDISAIVGDFIVWTKRALPAYQLAVVVDDHRQGITHVVRGDDLLDSAARQLMLFRALKLAPEPAYCHLPLIIGPDGKRLAKRHGDTLLEKRMSEGSPPQDVIGLLAGWCGLPAKPLTAAEFAKAFVLERLPKSPIVFKG
jgi:glutamyl-tRNA synthetase